VTHSSPSQARVASRGVEAAQQYSPPRLPATLNRGGGQALSFVCSHPLASHPPYALQYTLRNSPFRTLLKNRTLSSPIEKHLKM